MTAASFTGDSQRLQSRGGGLRSAGPKCRITPCGSPPFRGSGSEIQGFRY